MAWPRPSILHALASGKTGRRAATEVGLWANWLIPITPHTLPSLESGWRRPQLREWFVQMFRKIEVKSPFLAFRLSDDNLSVPI